MAIAYRAIYRIMLVVVVVVAVVAEVLLLVSEEEVLGPSGSTSSMGCDRREPFWHQRRYFSNTLVSILFTMTNLIILVDLMGYEESSQQIIRVLGDWGSRVL